MQAALVWLIAGWHLHRAGNRADLAAPLLTLAGGLSLASAVLALVMVQTAGQGVWSILTLGWTGAIWLGLRPLELSEICLHVGVTSLLAAWSLVLYHYFLPRRWTSICCPSACTWRWSVIWQAIATGRSRRTRSGGRECS